MQERTREFGGNTKNQPQTKKKKNHFFLSYLRGWKHLWVLVLIFFDRVSLEVLEQAQRTSSTSQLAPGQCLAGTTGAASPAGTYGCNILPRGGFPKDAGKMACEQRKDV